MNMACYTKSTTPMRTWNFIKYLELSLVIGILGFAYLPTLNDVEFHPDESQWIGTSDAFESYLRMEFDSPVWAPSYWTLTQPPVARYVIGLGRYVGGYHRPELNRPWDFERGRNFNERRGAIPSDGLLWWSRLPMAILAIGSVTLVFIVLRESSKRLTSYIWLGLVLINPYFTLHLRRAMGESCLLFFSMLTMYFGMRAMKLVNEATPDSSRNAVMWLILGGFAGGLASASKLNGLVIVGVNVIVAIVLGTKLNDSLKDKVLSSLWYGLVASLASLFVFLVVNPFLWDAPVERTLQMFENRTVEMDQQILDYAGSYMDFEQRLRIIPTRVFDDYASLPISALLNVILTLFGLMVLLIPMLKRDVLNAGHAVLMSTAFFTTTPLWLNPLDWDRYYIFPVLFSTIFIAIASGWLIKSVGRVLGSGFIEKQ